MSLTLLTGLLTSTGSVYTAIEEGKVAHEESINEKILTEFLTRVKREEIESLYSTQQARAGASGITLEGSPMLALADTLEKGAEDIVNIGLRSREDTIRKEGRARQIGSIAQGTGTLLTTLARR